MLRWLTLFLLFCTVGAQAQNVITPNPGDLIQIISPFNINPAFFYTTPSLLGGSGAFNNVVIASGTLTANQAALSITQTWNNAAVAFDAPIFANITNTASAAASQLIDLQVGGSSFFSVRKDGAAHVPNGGAYFFGAPSTSNSGLQSAGAGSVSLVTNGATAMTWTNSATNTNTMTWAGNAVSVANVAAATFQFGGTNAAAPVAQFIAFQGARGGTDSNTAGVDATITDSLGTGTGGSGKLIMKVGLTGSTGSVQNSAFPLLTLNPGTATTSTLQFGDGTNITTYDSCTGFTSSATGVLACTTSAMRFKELFPSHELNVAGLDDLRTDIPWKYKAAAGYGLDPTRLHVGLFADDVEKLDTRCVTYRDDKVKDYEDRCVIAYLVADRKELKARISALEEKLEQQR